MAETESMNILPIFLVDVSIFTFISFRHCGYRISDQVQAAEPRIIPSLMMMIVVLYK